MQTFSLIGSFLLMVFMLGVLLVLVFLLYHYLISILRAFTSFHAPFVPVPHGIISSVVETLNIDNQSVVYDLGCGDGRILKEAFRQKPGATYVGLERDALPYLLACLNTKKIRSSRFKILKKNFFYHDFGEATHLVTYLFPGLMDKLLPKLEKELPPGAILVSVSFSFSKREPERVIDLKRTSKQSGQRLYVYRF